MIFRNIFRPLAVACALAASLSACSSGTHEGDTNVEKGSTKMRPTTHGDGLPNNHAGDSATAGLEREKAHRPTGKDLYKAAENAKDRNHDGLAD
jgi:hypothetical protein